jgi:hypothetical protein
MLSSRQGYSHDHKAENAAGLVDVAGTTGADFFTSRFRVSLRTIGEKTPR